MSLKLREFPLSPAGYPADAKKRALWERHQNAIQEVVGKARSLSEDSERTLRSVKDKGLRDIAKG